MEPGPSQTGPLRAALIRSNGTGTWKGEAQAMEQTLLAKERAACKTKDQETDSCMAAREELRRLREVIQRIAQSTQKTGTERDLGLTVLATMQFAQSLNEVVAPKEELRLKKSCPRPKGLHFTPPPGSKAETPCDRERRQLSLALRLTQSALDLSWNRLSSSAEAQEFDREFRKLLQSLDERQGG